MLSGVVRAAMVQGFLAATLDRNVTKAWNLDVIHSWEWS